MKNILIPILAIIVFSGCSSTDRKAKMLIKQYLKEYIDDWSSYEPIKFERLDSVYTSVYDDPEYITEVKKIDSTSVDYIEWELKRSQNSISYSPNTEYYLYNRHLEMVITNPVLDSIKNHFIPTIKGWSLNHIFRSNENGFPKIHNMKFYFDKDINVILTADECSY